MQIECKICLGYGYGDVITKTKHSIQNKLQFTTTTLRAFSVIEKIKLKF